MAAQLVERSLPTPDVGGSNPIRIFLCRTFVYSQLYCIEKTKINKMRPGICPCFLKRDARSKTVKYLKLVKTNSETLNQLQFDETERGHPNKNKILSI